MSGRPTPGSTSRPDRLVALFLLALVLFNPPLLRLFGAPATLFGVPLIYAYILGAWAGVIGLAAVRLERR